MGDIVNFDGSDVSEEDLQKTKAYLSEVAEIEELIADKDVEGYLGLTDEQARKIQFYWNRRLYDFLGFLMSKHDPRDVEKYFNDIK